MALTLPQQNHLVLLLLPQDKTPQHSDVSGGWQLGKVYRCTCGITWECEQFMCVEEI